MSGKAQTLTALGRVERRFPQGEKSKSLCPQIKIIELARAGNIGAVLALRKQYAVGQRLVVFWHRDNAFFPGVITEFDSHKNSFRVDYDDGDIDLDFKPWTESIMIAQDVPKSADVVGATELKNSNAKNALEAKIKPAAKSRVRSLLSTRKRCVATIPALPYNFKRSLRCIFHA